MWLGRRPLTAWEKISTALYVHGWVRQMKGCNPIFCILTPEHHIGRCCWQAQFWTSHRGIPGGAPQPRGAGGAVGCIIFGKLLCNAPDLNEGGVGGGGSGEKMVLEIFVENLVDSGQ